MGIESDDRHQAAHGSSKSLRPRARQALPRHCLAADRVPLPVSSHLLGLRRSGAAAARAVGRWLDDSSAAAALSPLGQFGIGFCTACPAAGRPLVSALALRTLAWNQLHALT